MEQEVLTDLVMSYTEGSSYIFAFLSHINSSIMSLISPITRCIYCGHIVDLHDTMVLPVLCSSFIIANSHFKKKKHTEFEHEADGFRNWSSVPKPYPKQ